MNIKAILGGVVAFGFIGTSTVIASRFGWQLGTEEIDRYIFATAGGLADVLKALLPLFIAAAWASRQFLRAFLATVAFVVFTGYSLTASFGLAAIQKAAKIGEHSAVSTAYQDQRGALDALVSKRKALGDARPVGTIEAELGKLRFDKAWTASAECTDATVKSSRDLCKQVQDLEAQLATAKVAEELDRKIEAARTSLAGQDLKAVSTDADPQSTAISKLVGANEETVRMGLHGMLAALLEIGSGLGLYLVFGHHGARHRKEELPPHATPFETAASRTEPEFADDAPEMSIEGPGDAIERFIRESLVPAAGERISGSALFSAYEAWCDRQGLTPVSSAMFGRAVPWRKERAGGRVWYCDARLAHAAPQLRVAVDNDRGRLGSMPRLTLTGSDG